MTRKCKVCKTPFTPVRPMQSVCCPACAMVLARNVTEKALAKAQAADRKATREKLDAMRTKPQLVKLAQTAFNSFVRARDADKPCLSCGKPPSTQANSTDCGHYRSVGSAPHMRFVEDNAAGQCKHCNQHLAGNHVAYRQGLIQRIGQRAVDLIEADNTTRKYTREALIELARHYNAEARRLKRDASREAITPPVHKGAAHDTPAHQFV
jgi:hypothetical protein